MKREEVILNPHTVKSPDKNDIKEFLTLSILYISMLLKIKF
jgi:hypothetical protein